MNISKLIDDVLLVAFVCSSFVSLVLVIAAKMANS